MFLYNPSISDVILLLRALNLNGEKAGSFYSYHEIAFCTTYLVSLTFNLFLVITLSRQKVVLLQSLGRENLKLHGNASSLEIQTWAFPH